MSTAAYTASSLGIIPLQFMFIAFVFAAISLPILDIVWGEIFSTLKFENLTRSVFISFTIAVILYAFSSVAGFSVISAVLLLSAIGQSSILLYLINHSQKHNYFDQTLSDILSDSSIRNLMLSLSLLACASTIWIGRFEGYIENSNSLYVLFGMAICAILGFLLSFQNQLSISRILVISTLASAAIIAYSASNIYLGLDTPSTSIINGFSRFVAIVVWISIVISVKDSRRNPILMFGLGLFFLSVGQAFGALYGFLFKDNLVFALSFSLFLLVICMLTASCINTFTQVSENTIEEWQVKIDLLAANYKLTPRETEVLALWAKGWRMDRVGDELHVSKNTVKTHVGRIYEKTLTNNRDQLIQIIENL